MKRILFLTVLVFMLNALVAGALSLSVIEEQKQILVTLEEGRSVEFLVVIWNDALSILQDVEITSSGDISSWLSFEGSDFYTIDYMSGGGFAFMPVKISVPDGTGMGEYTGDIKADGSVLSRITARVVLSMPDIELLQETSDLDEEISRLSDELSKKIDLNREDLVRQIVELSEYSEDVSDLTSSKRELEDQLAELQNQLKDMEAKEQELDTITGQLSAGSSANLVIGLFVGALLVFLFLNRRKFTKKINSLLRPSKYKRREWKE